MAKKTPSKGVVTPKVKVSPFDSLEPSGFQLNRGDVKTVKISNSRNYDNGTYTTPWWLSSEGAVHSQVFAACRMYKRNWAPNYIDMVRDGLRYEDKEYSRFWGYSGYAKVVGNEQLSLNVTASAIDTLTSKIMKHTPSVSFLSEGGDYLIEEQTDELEKFIHAMYQNKQVDRLTPQVLKSACIYGTGIIHVHKHNRKKELEFTEVMPFELLFDLNSGMYNNRLTDFHILSFKSRYDVMDEFPEKKESILRCPVQSDLLISTSYNTDCILVIHSYSLVAKRHTVSVVNDTLLDEDWNFVDQKGDVLFPLASMRFEPGIRNFFGTGLSTKLKSIQQELNKLLRTAQRSSHLMSVPKLLVHRSAKVLKSSFDNSIGGVIQWSGQIPPQSMTLGQVPVDLFSQIDRFYERAYEISGVSQLSSSSRVPSQVESGRAMSTMYQIESDRFMSVAHGFENLYVDLANIVVSFYHSNAEFSQKAVVQTYFDREKSETIDFTQIDLNRDQYYITVFPISQLPQTPEGKYDLIAQWMQGGLIDPVFAKKLLKIPDTESYLNYENAEIDYVYKQISDMVRGTPILPLDSQDIQLALQMSQKAFYYYSTKGLKNEYLNYLQSYINVCQNIVQAQQQQMLQQQQQQQMAMMAQSQQQPGVSQ